ncbi:hypothetical protein AND_005082 [Anopheles darlingi]|uniref:Uncharacterized protein n=1 Tax=Anopheles darlingi TaxID=43151 RepID=W5JIW0_ANODA|nr:hypothetical protein AND_005082 [Anopheles darlingi]
MPEKFTFFETETETEPEWDDPHRRILTRKLYRVDQMFQTTDNKLQQQHQHQQQQTKRGCTKERHNANAF